MRLAPALVVVALCVALAECGAPTTTQVEAQVSASGVGAFEVAMAPFGDGAAIAWYDIRHANAEIYLRLVDALGAPIGSEYRLTADDEESYEVSIAPFEDALAVAWYARRTDSTLRAYVGVWDPEQGWHWRQPVSNGGSARNPVVTASDGVIFCAWIESDQNPAASESIRYLYFAADGSPAGSPGLIGSAGPETWNLNATFAGAGTTAFVVYDAPDNSGTYELFAASIDVSGTRRAQVSASDGFTSKYPDIAFASINDESLAALTWFDEKDGNQEVYLAVTAVADLLALDTNVNGMRLSRTDGASIGAYLAWNDDHIGVAWSDLLTDSFDIMLQAFDRTGAPVSDIVAVTNSEANSYVPAIVPWADTFAVAWNEYFLGDSGETHDTDGSEIYFRAVDVCLACSD